MTRLRTTQDLPLWQKLFLAAVGGLFLAGAINDARDLARRASGERIPQCAVISVTRPARCL